MKISLSKNKFLNIYAAEFTGALYKLRTYYRCGNEAVGGLSSVLWGYSSRDCLEILDRYFPDESSRF